MIPNKFFSIVSLLLIPGSGIAANISKANNSIDLDQSGSWIGGVVPGPDDVAVWDWNFINGFLNLSNNANWKGIYVDPFSANRVNVSAPNLVPVTLSLGASGIVNDATSAKTASVGIRTDLICTAAQSWSGLNGAGRVISILGRSHYDNANPEPIASIGYVRLGGNTVTINNTEVRISGDVSMGYEVSNGSFVLNDSSLRVSSASSYWYGAVLAPAPMLNVPSSLSIVVNTGSEVIPWNNSRQSENLVWNAAVTLNGGTLHAHGWGAQLIGSSGTAESHSNTLGGTIEVASPSVISLSSEIGSPKLDGSNEPIETRHKITADISGSSALSFKNHATVFSKSLIVLSGDNSGLAGSVGIVGTQGIRTVRLASDTAGSASSSWSIGGSNTLEVENSAVSLGSLVGTGSLVATGGGASTVSVGGGVFSGAASQDETSTLNFRKVGAGTHTFVGVPGWKGETIVDGGVLSVVQPKLHQDTTVRIATGAFLNLPHGKPDGVEALVIAGVNMSAGTYGAINSGAQFETSAITGSGRLLVTGSDPYSKWIGNYSGIANDADRLGNADPDGDGIDNLGEFGLAGDPSKGSDSGPQFMAVDPDLRLVIAVRVGAEFIETDSELVSDPIDGVIYRIQATTDLINYDDVQVFESFGIDLSEITPVLPDGWEYRSFDVDLGPEFAERGFVRASVETAP
jgi:hypothetical protein